MYFILPLLLFLAVMLWLAGRKTHNHEFILLSYIFVLAAFGVASILYLSMNALPS